MRVTPDGSLVRTLAVGAGLTTRTAARRRVYSIQRRQLMGGQQVADKIQFRRDTSSNWTSVNPILSQGELGLELDTLKYKIGDGTSTWSALAYNTLSGAVGGLDFVPVGAEPSVPATNLTLYAKAIAGRIMPRFVGPSGLQSFLQPFIARSKIRIWHPPGGAATIPGVFGYGALTIVGTATTRAFALTNLFSKMARLGIVSVSTAAGLSSFRQAVVGCAIGNGADGQGFVKVFRFGCSDAATVAGARQFVGVSSSVAAPTNVEPSTLTNSIGVGHGAANTNLFLYYGGSVAQAPIDLGANFPANTLSVDAYELALFSPPNQNGVVKWEVTRLNTGHVASGTINGSGGVILPATTTPLSYAWGYRTNNATALAVGLDIMSDYVETDY